MSVENGKVCCNCRHNIRYWDEGGMCHCKCVVNDKYMSYIQVMTGWCRHWSRDKAESEEKE